jgi:pyruvate/2-oxoglutarate dehydrogenase complex dihydrolipoamide acyltransferase (E2) component
MAIAVTMPQMGESVVEGTVERWLVREGERVAKDQVLCEITTEKVDAEVVAPEAGVVAKLLVAQGTTVPVGTELMLLDPAGGAARVEPPAAAVAAATPIAPVAAAKPALEPARVSPVARRMAEERGIDVGAIPGSGVSGRITKADVEAHAPPIATSGAPAARAAPGRPPGNARRLPREPARPHPDRAEDTVIRSPPSGAASPNTWWCRRWSRRTSGPSRKSTSPSSRSCAIG